MYNGYGKTDEQIFQEIFDIAKVYYAHDGGLVVKGKYVTSVWRMAIRCYPEYGGVWHSNIRFTFDGDGRFVEMETVGEY